MNKDIEYRQQIMEWWNQLAPLNKQAFVNVVLEAEKRSYKTLTGIEIQKIYEWEHSLIDHKIKGQL